MHRRNVQKMMMISICLNMCDSQCAEALRATPQLTRILTLSETQFVGQQLVDLASTFHGSHHATGLLHLRCFEQDKLAKQY